ncbi:hypothetical protein jhhlp_008072 [Lomentospora prolificans]|uniref:non-specific serine/threonine protein kinase n=1 Tax=Lomentospora prolificans TaxID=41688 RepID=A0A2N3MZG2_9PEZI|nr:hypothetical protein jhhlp_008072 [Lomentospora prolificans]
MDSQQQFSQLRSIHTNLSHSDSAPPPTTSSVHHHHYHARTANSTPMSSPGLFSPTNSRPNHPFHLHSSSEVTTPSGEGASPFLHPLQHQVRETHKANIDSDITTGRKSINQYEVIEEIGRGMHGKVKLARNNQTGENVAIKIIPRFSKKRRLGKVMAAMSQQDKTKREIAILKKIRHPNVVALLEIIDDPELRKIYMVLEHVELGEIVWRKKGLPHICQYERRRVEREMRDDPISPEEQKYNEILERRQALKELKRAKMSLAYAGTHDYWSIEHGLGDESAPGSRINSHRELAFMDRAGTSMPNSLQPSRNSSRAPSRSQSVKSLGPYNPSDLLHDSAINDDTDDDAQENQPLSTSNSSVMLDGTMYGAYTGEALDHRARSPSMADSIISHMSSLDFNPQPHDPFVDDYSYVPCFTLDQARQTFRDTVLGLEYLHYQGVVHRDIKPANLLWTRDHRVKISDFGVSYFGRPIRDGEPDDTVSESEAKDFDDDLELAKTVGTPAFFAPELCYTDPDKAQPKVSEQIDVWSLGVTLYCLIYARIPFLAEDEFQMFRKIANDPVYIPRRRLRPVDPSTSPNATSLYKRQNSDPYRDDNELLYEDVDDLLEDLLRRMLTKDPEKRIRLREIKRHPWVVQGIPDLIKWLDETDPARPSFGRKIQVDENEMSDAVVPLTLFQRARSVMRKTVTKIVGPLVERSEGRGRRRATSSVASSSGDALASVPTTPYASGNGRHGATTRQEQLSSSPRIHSPVTGSVTTTPQETPSYDPLATILGPGKYTAHGPEARYPESPSFARFRSSATPPPSYKPYRHAHAKSMSIDPSYLTTIPDNVASTDVDLPDDNRTTRAIDPSSVAGSPRARSVDGFEAAVPPRRESLLTQQLRPLGNYSAPVEGGSPLPSPLLFSSSAVHGYQHHQHSNSEPNIPEKRRSMDSHERPSTARRLLTAIHRRSSDMHEVGASSPRAQHVEFAEEMCNSPGTKSPAVAAPQQEEPAEEASHPRTSSLSTEKEPESSVVSSRSASMDVSVSSVSSPDEQASLIPSSKTGPTTVSSDHILAFQSDPSLPALLSGASSVSADMEAELLGRPGVVSANPNLLETTDSLTPPAIGKEPISGFPLEIAQSVDSGIISVAVTADKATNGSVPREPSRQQNEREDNDDDSDSDEGLTMMSNRRKPCAQPARSRHTSMAKRRSTGASSTSIDAQAAVDAN